MECIACSLHFCYLYHYTRVYALCVVGVTTLQLASLFKFTGKLVFLYTYVSV